MNPAPLTAEELDAAERLFLEHGAFKHSVALRLIAAARRGMEALDVLELLVDHQNGPPIPSYTKRWGEAMDRASVLLGRSEAADAAKTEAK